MMTWVPCRDFYGGRSPRSYRIRAGTATAYCSVAHLWLLVCPSIRFHIDGRVQRHRQRSRTRGPQAEFQTQAQRGPQWRSSARERLSPLSRSGMRSNYRLAEAAGTFSQRECELSGSTVLSDRVHQAPRGPHIDKRSSGRLSESDREVLRRRSSRKVLSTRDCLSLLFKQGAVKLTEAACGSARPLTRGGTQRRVTSLSVTHTQTE